MITFPIGALVGAEVESIPLMLSGIGESFASPERTERDAKGLEREPWLSISIAASLSLSFGVQKCNSSD